MTIPLEEYLTAKIEVQIIARRYKLTLNALIKRPRVQAHLSYLGLKPIGEYIRSEQLELEHWEALLEWMNKRIR